MMQAKGDESSEGAMQFKDTYRHIAAPEHMLIALGLGFFSQH